MQVSLGRRLAVFGTTELERDHHQTWDKRYSYQSSLLLLYVHYFGMFGVE
jgi:hypothetical protein